MSSSDSSPQDAKTAAAPDDSMGQEKLGLPTAKPLRFDRAQDSPPARASRNGEPDENTAKLGTPLFNKLVTADDDLIGLVAYGLYKQNKYDWLAAFEKSCGRRPTGDESRAYVVGEGTPRRVATYRQIAESALAARILQAEPRSMAELRSTANQAERDSFRDEAPRPPTRQSTDGSGPHRVPKNSRTSLFYVAFICVLAGLCVWFLAFLGVVKI
jgi:hypothetical protein